MAPVGKRKGLGEEEGYAAATHLFSPPLHPLRPANQIKHTDVGERAQVDIRVTKNG